MKKMVDSELNEVLQFIWDEDFKAVARAYVNREPRRGPIYEKKLVFNEIPSWALTFPRTKTDRKLENTMFEGVLVLFVFYKVMI